MPNDDIDLSDAPETPNWSNATRGVLKRQNLLDEDVTNWLARQDAETKSHIGDMIRHVMAMQA